MIEIKRDLKGRFIGGYRGYSFVKGKHLSEEHKKKISIGNKREINKWCAFCEKKFITIPSYLKRGGGKFCSTKCRDSSRTKKTFVNCRNCSSSFLEFNFRVNTKQEHFCSRRCLFEFRRGVNSPNWKNEKRELRDRHVSEYENWRIFVLKRDNYICQKCKDTNYQGRGKSVYLEVHHILPYSQFPEFKYNNENGITLCRKCHLKIRGKEGLYGPQFLGI